MEAWITIALTALLVAVQQSSGRRIRGSGKKSLADKCKHGIHGRVQAAGGLPERHR